MPNIDKTVTARAIKYFREHKKLSKREMARRLEISPSHYGNLEAGRNAPPYKVVVSLMEMGLDLIKYIGKDKK